VRERHGSFRNQYATLKSSNGDNRIDLWMPRKNSDELERQFSELSSILVGKNAIIESQRRQLQTERTVNEELEKSSEQARSELEEWKQRCQALERELNLIREMGTKQEFMGNKVGFSLRIDNSA
jgi:chromosome segregation ATPase